MHDQNITTEVQNKVVSFVTFIVWMIVFVIVAVIVFLFTFNPKITYEIAKHLADNFLNYILMIITVSIIALSVLNSLNHMSEAFKNYEIKNSNSALLKLPSIPDATLREFVKIHIGKQTQAGSNPPVLKGECVSLVRLWHAYIGAQDVYWAGNYPIPAFRAFQAGEASILVDNSTYKIVPITNANDLRSGDTLILNTYGRSIPSHTAILVELNPVPSINTMRVFEQNSPVGAPPTVAEYNTKTFVGGLRTALK
jgi:hypothetical protein